jgi:hypothetical protein
MTAVDFRRDFPAFIDSNAYPGPVIDMYLGVALTLLRPERWTTALDYGTGLFVAHNLMLEAKEMASAANGKTSSSTAGPISSKSVGGISVSYDSSSGVEVGAGHWNDTTYGRRFIRLAKMMGAGPITIMPSGMPQGFDGAWPGVTTFGSM